MTQISISDLKVNPGKYIEMAQNQEIFVTRNGKVAAKIVSAKPDKKAAWEGVVNIFRSANINLTDEQVEHDREERVLRP